MAMSIKLIKSAIWPFHPSPVNSINCSKTKMIIDKWITFLFRFPHCFAWLSIRSPFPVFSTFRFAHPGWQMHADIYIAMGGWKGKIINCFFSNLSRIMGNHDHKKDLFNLNKLLIHYGDGTTTEIQHHNGNRMGWNPLNFGQTQWFSSGTTWLPISLWKALIIQTVLLKKEWRPK